MAKVPNGSVTAPKKPQVADELIPEYKAEAMLDLMVKYPYWSMSEYAEHFGRNMAWMAGVLASKNFQIALAPRKAEIENPAITASLTERFEALALHSIMVLQNRLTDPGVPDMVVLQAAALSIRAMSVTSATKPAITDASPAQITVEKMSEKLLRAMDSRDALRTLKLEVSDASLAQLMGSDLV